MTKLTEAHFNIFKKECLKWVEKLKLDNWEIHFRWQDDREARASCTTELSNYIATLFLSREWDYKPQSLEIQAVAKHETIHLLLGRYSTNAGARYINRDDLEESEEELVRKLEKLL